jgi:molecular chaperone DnaJ
MAKDYYATLGVERTASQEEIKQAYRRLAREFHPDVRKDDPHADERFKEINEAYYVLSDPDRRSQYDRFGRVGDVRVPDTADLFGGFDDLLEMFFGTGARGSRAGVDEASRGSDLRYDLEISLEEAARGVERSIVVSRLETCTVCFGTGREAGSAPETCPTCRGNGQVRYQQQTVFGYFSQVVTCRQCGGRGTIIRRPCPQCRGTGRREAERELTVTVPPGVDTGTRLRLGGEGEGGVHGGGRGDLYVVIHVKPHPAFAREGPDLFCETTVSMFQAALGDEIAVPAIDEEMRVAIPPGTQPGSRLRLQGKGMPRLDGGRGDLYVRIRVEIPREMSTEQRRALMDIADLRGETIRPQKPSLWKKMKEFLQ